MFSPGNLFTCSEMAGVNFASHILASIERKLEIRDEYPGHFTNAALAVMSHATAHWDATSIASLEVTDACTLHNAGPN